MTAPFFPRILGAVAFLNQETEPLTMNLQHHFLIAMPALQDPIFRRSVVYICEHNTNGAMGIIVNKPLENLKIEGILEKLKITPEPRDESIRLDKPVMLSAVRWLKIAGLFCILRPPILLPAFAFQTTR